MERKYRVRIKTKYNEINLIVDDINSPEMKEILDQPYIEGVYIDTMNHYKEEEYAGEQDTKGYNVLSKKK